MPTDKDKGTSIYNRDTMEFLTVAKQFCTFVESTEGMKRELFVNTMLKLLPLLYLKAVMLDKVEHDEDVYPETFVTEDSYEIVRINIASIMGELDDYLDVFMEDMVYSDKPILSTISENIADIYQDIRDMVFSFQLEYEESRKEALATCIDNFDTIWGQKLVNVMRALHSARHSVHECDDENCGCHDND
ncbi:MAG TPA: DUF5063 domain-containing protein [Candidatus Avibacteroides faecavium]|nr:DUF5063 domain-containing protein [Candidatus Avibacteroides faecavium]